MPRKSAAQKAASSQAEERPAKRAKFLSDDEGSDSEGGDGGVSLTINAEFAKKFEYNKKREERAQLEEKYKKSGRPFPGAADEESESDSETSEEEDDAAELATAELDNEIFATLEAIKKKDPRVYDPEAKFYSEFDPEALNEDGSKKEKPMYLKDYHRQNLLSGAGADGAVDEDADAPVQTYAQEQEALKQDVVKQMHAAAEEDEDDEDGFMVKKSKSTHEDMPVHESRRSKIKELDVENAEKDPESYLSNFMAARAWVPNSESKWQAFDSDDEEEMKRAEEFEEAYNMRFEDPAKANEKLQSFARDVGKYSVRRDEVSGRKKQREKERDKKDAAKRERDEEKARLRKLKIEEVEEKVKRIKEAAGLKGQALDLDEWGKVLEEDWDDDRWEQEMKKRFDEQYYEEDDAGLKSDVEDEAEDGDSKKKKPKKPKWDDDIDIKDLIPDFKDDEEAAPAFSLSDEEGDDDIEMGDADGETSTTKPKTKKDRLQERADAKRAARKERQRIEEMVDASLATEVLPATKRDTSGFRYRETSPTSYGLTARDILFADDAALNQYAGLKKMAAFRDEEKKRKDKKKLGKKARLRQWRKETFGDEEGFAGGFKEFLSERGALPAEEGEAGAKDGGGKKKRSKKRKAPAEP